MTKLQLLEAQILIHIHISHNWSLQITIVFYLLTAPAIVEDWFPRSLEITLGQVTNDQRTNTALVVPDSQTVVKVVL